MKRIWDTIAAMLLTALLLKMLFDLIEPYVLWIILGGALVAVGVNIYRKAHYW